MKFRFPLALAAVWLTGYVARAQSTIPGQFKTREALIEAVALRGGETADFEAVLEELDRLQKNPVDLNKATASDLQRLPFLTDFQVNSLIDYRKEYGYILSMNELPLVYGFTDEVIAMILPFVTLSAEKDTLSILPAAGMKYADHEIVLRTQRVLEKSRGYTETDTVTGNTRYPGNPWLYYARYRMELNDRISAGITLEKDPGEDFFRNSNKNGFDFYSAHVMVRDAGPLKAALAGDFRLGFGQGLTLSHGTAPGKSSMPLNIVKRGEGIKAFTSTDENDFFRGVAATAGWGRLAVTGFYSRKNRDAHITDTLGPGMVYFSSFQESGHHRTSNEISGEKAVGETAFGGNVTFRGNFFKIGTTLVQYKLDKVFEAGDDLKDIRDFEGSSLLNWGADYSVVLKKLQLFGETAYGNHSWATLNGALLSVSKYASFVLLYRNYSSGYFSLHSDAFSEGSSDVNEEALYAGVVIHPVGKLKVSAYADFYRFPWLRYRLSSPASGSDYLLQLDYFPGGRTEMYLRIRHELNPGDEVPVSQVLPVVTYNRHTGIRYHITYRYHEVLRLQNRLEVVRAEPGTGETSWGFMIYQDAGYRFRKVPVNLDFRLAWFHTDDYGSRIYAYEQDLTSGFTFSPLYEKGYLTYLMARYALLDGLLLGVRFEQTRYLNRDHTGSGLDEVPSSARSEVKIQLTWRL